MVMKGLPLAYSKDMQEDKEATFDALASLRLALAAMTGMVEDLEPNARGHARGRRRRLLHRHRPRRLAGARAGPAVPRGPPRHRAHRGRRRGQGRRPWTSCRSRTCRPSSPRITEDVFSVLSVRELGQEPHQLWGNGATERAQNGASLDKAVGKGRRKGLELGIRGPETSGCFGGRLALRTVNRVQPGSDAQPSAAWRCGRAPRAGRARPRRLRRARPARGAAEARQPRPATPRPARPASPCRTSPPSSTR